jgi:acetyl/propionyl-CoA carboxylase alpha subunit
MRRIAVTLEGRIYTVELDQRQIASDEPFVTVDGERVPFAPHRDASGPFNLVIVGGRPVEAVFDTGLKWVRSAAGYFPLEVRDLDSGGAAPASGDGRVKAPIPGLIRRLLVERGARVRAGQTLMLVEAMKMENPIAAPHEGTVMELFVAEGQRVTLGEVLAEVTGP